MENADLHCIATNQCPICIAPINELPDVPYPTRDHRVYAVAYQAADVESLKKRDGVKHINNALWHITDFQVYKIVKPDIVQNFALVQSPNAQNFGGLYWKVWGCAWAQF